jgi:hypothetical protein
MNVEPKLEYRKDQPYVAVRAQVVIPFGELLGGLWGEANAFLVDKGLAPSGPPFIRYLTTDMDKKLDIEVGFPVSNVVVGNDRITTGVFSAGLEAKATRAIDIGEGDKLDESALKELICAAVDFNKAGSKKK